MWPRLATSSFAAYLFSFLAGVFASTAVNLFTGTVFVERATVRGNAVILSIVFFLVSSASTAIVAWYLDEMYSRWVREGRPTDKEHVESIVKPIRTRATIALIIALMSVVVGGLQLYLATLPAV